MKVGIITYHSVYNYGAVLQSYALVHTINDLGYHAEIVNYKNKYMDVSYNSYQLKNSFDLLKLIIRFFINKNSKYRFNTFIDNNCILSKKKYNLSNRHEINDDFDLIITGSDQVWNYELNDYDRTYYLDIVDSKKKNSYAASYKYRTLSDWYKKDLYHLLSNYNRIGVRESSLKGELEKLLNTNIELNVDPIFLLDVSKWLPLIGNKIINKKYIFLYFIGSVPKDALDIAYAISKRYKFQIINISNSLRKIKGISNINNAGPKEFLNYLYYSSFVITNSFHGTALSINFGKNFIVQDLYNDKGEKDPRIETVIISNGVKQCYFSDFDINQSLSFYGNCNHELINHNVEKSKKYLLDILKSN